MAHRLRRLFSPTSLSTKTQINLTKNPSIPDKPETLNQTINNLFNERSLDRLTQSFKVASNSYRFRCRHRIYDTVVGRLSAARRRSSIVEVIDFQKQFKEDFKREGFGVRLILLYGKAGIVDDAKRMFEEIGEIEGATRTIKSFNALMTVYEENREFGKVVDAFDNVPEGTALNRISYNILIKALCNKGQKRVNEDKDTGLEKMAEVVDKGEGMQEEEQEVNDNVKKLRALLEDDPRNVIYKKADEAIRYLKATDIINWASSSNKVEEKAMEEYGYLDEDTDKFVPSFEKVDRLMRLMLVRGIDELEAVDLYILYNNFPKSGFTSMLLHALDSYSERQLMSGQSVYPKDMRSSILKACPVLCWKLFAHVMYELTSLSAFSYSVSTATTGTSEEKGMQKKAAENCIICSGSGKHGGVYGDYCSYWEYVPSGVTVGSTHVVHCRECYEVGRHGRKFVRCTCGSREGVAVPRGLWWDSDIYNNNEDQSTPG